MRNQLSEAVPGVISRTDGALSIRIILFCHVVCSLVFEVGYTTG